MAATPKPLRKEVKSKTLARKNYVNKEAPAMKMVHKKEGKVSKEIAQHSLSNKKHPGNSMKASVHRDKKLGYVK